MQLSEDEWRAKLTPEQYHSLREKGNEYPGSGKYVHHDKQGVYTCGGCGAELFKSDSKYESNIESLAGWPSFADPATTDTVNLVDDYRYGMYRQEVVCKNCGSHLGHLFTDASSPTGQHYCINSCSLDFKEKN